MFLSRMSNFEMLELLNQIQVRHAYSTYSLPFKRSQVLAPCTSSSFYPILLLIG